MTRSAKKAMAATLLAACAALAPAQRAAAADAPSVERLQVTDPYIELHTGPGRGFPVFFVAERNEWIEIDLRHTDWFRVRTAGGKVGWVHRPQLATTLTAAGGAKTFRDVAVDDYLNRRLEMGAAWGRFKSEPMVKLWTGYKLGEGLRAEATLGQVQGVYSGTDFWHVNVSTEPWADQRWSPFFAIGVGKFKNLPNSSLVGATTTDSNMANASVGLRWYLSERFIVRTDYTLYTVFVSDARTSEYGALTVGMSFFF
jgi:SH3-like domain-containing protein